MSKIKQCIQKNIAFYRKNAKLTQKELAEKLEIPTTNLASWEQGKSMPDIDMLFKICSILKVDILTISGYEMTENGENAFANFNQAFKSINEHSAKLGEELSIPLNHDEQELIKNYRELSEQGQEYIRQTMYMAKQTYKKMPDFSGVEKQA